MRKMAERHMPLVPPNPPCFHAGRPQDLVMGGACNSTGIIRPVDAFAAVMCGVSEAGHWAESDPQTPNIITK